MTPGHSLHRTKSSRTPLASRSQMEGSGFKRSRRIAEPACNKTNNATSSSKKRIAAAPYITLDWPQFFTLDISFNPLFATTILVHKNEDRWRGQMKKDGRGQLRVEFRNCSGNVPGSSKGGVTWGHLVLSKSRAGGRGMCTDPGRETVPRGGGAVECPAPPHFPRSTSNYSITSTADETQACNEMCEHSVVLPDAVRSVSR